MRTIPYMYLRIIVCTTLRTSKIIHSITLYSYHLWSLISRMSKHPRTSHASTHTGARAHTHALEYHVEILIYYVRNDCTRSGHACYITSQHEPHTLSDVIAHFFRCRHILCIRKVHLLLSTTHMSWKLSHLCVRLLASITLSGNIFDSNNKYA
jgi:hypothetical protein